MAYIRLLTYCILVVIIYLAGKQTRVIPVAIYDYAQEAEAKARAKELVTEIERISAFRGFCGMKQSGRELLVIATREATEHGRKATEFKSPEIKVQLNEGRAIWVLRFTRDYGPNVGVAPAEMFSVTIDDESGHSLFRDETASM